MLGNEQVRFLQSAQAAALQRGIGDDERRRAWPQAEQVARPPASAIMLPKLGSGGRKPMPTTERPAITVRSAGMPNASATAMLLITFGNR